MSKGLKNALRLVCFLLVFLVLYSCVATLLVAKNYQWENFRGLYSERRDSLDFMYLGSSACYMSWMPYDAWAQSGLTSYTFAMSSLPSYAYVPMLKEAGRMQQPQLFIIDVRPFVQSYVKPDLSDVTSGITVINAMKTFSPNRLPLAARCYELYSDKVAAGQVESQGETFASFLFDIIRYHVTWRELDKSYFPKASVDLPYNCSKGYYGTDLCEVFELTNNSAVTSTLAIHPDAQADLESVLDQLDKTGAQALFVNAPSGESVEEKQKYNYIARLVGERGYSFVDFNDLIDDMGIDAGTDFYNRNHLNIYGSEKYTAYLMNYILENYELSPRHSQKAEADWCEGYSVWLNIKDNIKSH